MWSYIAVGVICGVLGALVCWFYRRWTDRELFGRVQNELVENEIILKQPEMHSTRTIRRHARKMSRSKMDVYARRQWLEALRDRKNETESELKIIEGIKSAQP